MRDSERRAKLNQVLLTVQSVLADEGLSKRIAQEQGGFGSTELGKMTSRTTTSAVEPQVVAPPTSQAVWVTDQARIDLDRLDSIIDKMFGLAKGTDAKDGLDQLRRRYPKPRAGTPAKGDDRDACELCARSKRWNPPLPEATNVDGILPRKYQLCATCATLVANLGRLPQPHEHADAHDKGKVKVKANK